MISLEGKTALIAGATGGMGSEIALSLAVEDVNLILLGRNPEKLEKLRKKVLRVSDVKVEILVLDLGKPIVEDLKEFLKDHAHMIDILVYAAGLIIPGLIEEVTEEDFEQQFNVNFKSAFSLVQYLVPQLKERGGQIVLINSSIIHNAKRHLSVYGISKHALTSLTKAIREELNESGVRVINLVPGKTATQMQDMLASRFNLPIDPERMLQVRDIALTVVLSLRVPYTAEITDLMIRPMKK